MRRANRTGVTDDSFTRTQSPALTVQLISPAVRWATSAGSNRPTRNTETRDRHKHKHTYITLLMNTKLSIYAFYGAKHTRTLKSHWASNHETVHHDTMTKMFWGLLSNRAIIMFLLHVVNYPNILCCYFVYMHLHQGLHVTSSQTEQRRRSASQIQIVQEQMWSIYN